MAFFWAEKERKARKFMVKKRTTSVWQRKSDLN